jgi:hypothetical protein
MIIKLTTGTLAFLSLLQTGSVQYQDWRHSGSMYILTTPEGANLPATAAVENLPLLVRLDKDFFDFKQAQAKCEDLRFAAEGKALAYQIEAWDSANGTASIWLRVPRIKGNARQELKMFWGKADAKSESSGKAVFSGPCTPLRGHDRARACSSPYLQKEEQRNETADRRR